MWTALAHVPSKEKQSRPQTTAVLMSHPGANSLGDPSLGTDDSGSQTASDDSSLDQTVTTDPDSFGIYRVYAWKPLREPSTLNTHCDAHTEDSSLSSNHGPETGMQTTPYYYPFSNPSAAAIMVGHYSGGPVLSKDKMTKLARTLGSLGFDLDPVDLCNFDTALETRKLDTYLTSALESTLPREDGWLESSVRI
jgi:hypothetical protein